VHCIHKVHGQFVRESTELMEGDEGLRVDRSQLFFSASDSAPAERGKAEQKQCNEQLRNEQATAQT
jgi:hypothetical protein